MPRIFFLFFFCVQCFTVLLFNTKYAEEFLSYTAPLYYCGLHSFVLLYTVWMVNGEFCTNQKRTSGPCIGFKWCTTISLVLNSVVFLNNCTPGPNPVMTCPSPCTSGPCTVFNYFTLQLCPCSLHQFRPVWAHALHQLGPVWAHALHQFRPVWPHALLS